MNSIKKFFLDLAGKDSHAKEVSTAVAEASAELIKASRTSVTEVLAGLNSSVEGLSEEEAGQRLEKYGKNEVAHEKAPPWFIQLIRAFFNPFVGILVILAIATFLTEYIFAPQGEKDLTALMIIIILILISVLLTFFQEYQASRAADQLLALIQNRTTVKRRNSEEQELITTELVPGDIVRLSAGDIIPADVRIVAANNLSLNEAALTGESLPVEKNEIGNTGHEHISALDLDNIAYMGTNVVSGTAQVVVLATGSRTYFGTMSKELVGHHPPTSFDIGIKNVSLLLIRFMLIMVPVIFLISGITQGNWFQALLFGLAVAVGLTPEMLPTIITANLAKGTIEMARQKTVIKKLNAIQNLGAMDLLCTDKTGTLTEDSVALERFTDFQGNRAPAILEYLFLNSYYQTGLKNPLDEAILEHEEIKKLADLKLKYKRIGEIPFATERRRMSVVVEKEDGERLLITKGAIAEMLDVSASLFDGIRAVPLDMQMRRKVERTAEEMNNDGMRVLILAYRVIDRKETHFRAENETGLTLIGLVGFLDPPKESAGPALEALQRQGVRVCVITGDNEIATRRICREIGFKIEGLIEGYKVDEMSEKQLGKVVEEANLFVRTSPLQKSRILNALKNNGHTVGFLGDGINDAPALRDSDVGISVDNAVDIAKESADIILLEKSLMILEEGIGRGRLVFGNIMKYIKMTVSSNFGNVFSVLVAAIVLPFPPMLPLHLLVQNLLYDISQISIPWDRVDDEYLQLPQRWNPQSIARFTLYIGPVSSFFDFTTFAILWHLYGANTVAEQSFFHSGWFVLGLLSQTLIVHIIRTRKIPFMQSTASRPVIVMTGIVMLVGLVLPFTPFGEALGFVYLPGSYLAWLFLTLLAYFIVMQAVKTWYINRFGTWL